MVVKEKYAIPVTIYKNGEIFKEFTNVQEATKFMKTYTKDTHYRYSRIENCLTFGDLWYYEGDTYSFRTDEKIRIAKFEQHRRGIKR